MLLACGLTLACVSTERARAEEYPARPVRIVVPNEPGGAYDFVGRLLAHELSQRLGQSVYVENRPGAGSVTGTQAAAGAPANGYTLLVGGLSNIVFNAALYRNLPYDPARDLVPVALVNSFPYVLVARKGLPAADLGGVIDAARKQPDALTIGMPGAGSAPHILGVAVMKTAGVRLVEVPYKGIQAPLTDLLGERVDLLIASEGAALPYLKAGQHQGHRHAPASARSRYAPDLPTMQEPGLPLEMTPGSECSPRRDTGRHPCPIACGVAGGGAGALGAWRQAEPRASILRRTRRWPSSGASTGSGPISSVTPEFGWIDRSRVPCTHGCS